jgi:hypothetical protein
MFLRRLNRLATSAGDPCGHGPRAGRMNRELSAVTYAPIASTVVSVCPKHAGGELKFAIGIETQNEKLDYLIDTRSAILLAYGLLAHGLLDYLRLFQLSGKPFHLSGSDGTPSADALNPSS